MPTTIGVHITPEKVKEVKAKIAKLEAWLVGAEAVLANDLDGGTPSKPYKARKPVAHKSKRVAAEPVEKAAPKRQGKKRGDPNSFMGQLVRLANEAPEPITREEHKDQLRKLGFPEEKMKKPYIFAINRTADAGRITLLSNGKIWKGDR